MKRMLATILAAILSMLTFATLAPKARSGVPYDWPMFGYDLACTGFSPSAAPNVNTIAWVSNMPTAGAGWWPYPIVAEGKVFIGLGGNLTAWDEYDGHLVWSREAPVGFGSPSNIAIAEGVVFCITGEGNVYASNATTGEHIWNLAGGQQYSFSPPIVVDGRLYLGGGFTTGVVHCVNATNGTPIWSYSPTQDAVRCIAVAYGKVYASTGSWETSTEGAIYCLDMYNGGLVWSFNTHRDYAGDLAVANGKVYFSASYEGWNCIIYALDATNGAVVWSTSRYPNGEAGRIAVAYGKVFICLGYSGRGVYALNEADGGEVWAFPIIPEQPVPGHQNNPPWAVVADNKVFFGMSYPGHMFYAVGQSTGSIIWSYRLAGAVGGRSGAVGGGLVFVPDYWNLKLYAFGGAPVVPTANFTWSPPMPRATKTMRFDASSSTPDGGIIVSYWWNFGDGNITTTTDPVITHRYANPNRYSVNLTVLDSEGLTNSIIKAVKITHLADINTDGRVDIMDLAMVSAAFGSYPGHLKWNLACDVNGDNRIDIYDVAYICRHYGWFDP